MWRAYVLTFAITLIIAATTLAQAAPSAGTP